MMELDEALANICAIEDNHSKEERLPKDVILFQTKLLSEDEKEKLNTQNIRKISSTKANQLEKDARRHWDIFYKRNQTKFFKDRHWTTREFHELLKMENEERLKLLELGCGVGNLVYPLLEDGLKNIYFFACDFSPRAVDFVKQNPLYDETKIKAFQADITTDELFAHLEENSIDIVTMVFVLSAINPEKFELCIKNAFKVLKSGGMLLFRDYGRYDMAQLRFKPGHKIDENLYMRQDGTRSYYFSIEEMAALCQIVGFEILFNAYVQRRTVNIKENIDSPRLFLQGKFRKPDLNS